MKYYELKQIASFLKTFKHIFAIERVDDNVLKLTLDRKTNIYADLKRGQSSMFMCEDFVRQKPYTAPFDVMLRKYFAKSSLLDAQVLPSNRILKLSINAKNGYKEQRLFLQLEFTGKNTNAIILDENHVVQAALRHIDKSVSFRSVCVGERLEDLPPFSIKEEIKEIKDIKELLYHNYIQKEQKALAVLKASKQQTLQKKLNHLQKELDKLPLEKDLRLKAQELNKQGGLILANLHQIKPYAKEVTLEEYDGTKQTIHFPKEVKSPQMGANMLYEKSKKLKQKADSIHIEKQNLEEKMAFLQNLKSLIHSATSSSEVQILAPKKTQNNKKTKQNELYESFFMDGYKLMVGKSEKSNIALLKIAKKSDIWMHIQDFPSSHVIIRTDKQNLPQNVLEFGAKLCVNFSKTKAGSFLVDFTAYKNVKIQSGAKVFYTNFKTIKVSK